MSDNNNHLIFIFSLAGGETMELNWKLKRAYLGNEYSHFGVK